MQIATRTKVIFFHLLVLALVFCSGPAAWSAESVTLAWDRNPESDVIGYQLYYGTTSGNYSQHVNVGNATEVVLPGLEPSTTYYAVVTAYNSAGLESFLSEELAFEVEGSRLGQPATLVFLEAETGGVTAPTVTRPDPTASGGAFLETGPEGYGGQVIWGFPAPAGPAWQIWARVKVPAGSQGTLVVMANDGTSVLCHPDPEDKPAGDQWTWARLLSPAGTPHTVVFTEGMQTLSFRGEAAQTGLDRIVLSADPAFIPPADLPSSGDYLTLTTQPQSLTVFAGAQAGLTATAASTGEVYYQWYQDDVPIPEAHQPYLPVERMPSESATYRLVATLGDESVSSGTAGVTVLPPPVLELTRAASTEDGLRLNVQGRQRQALILEYSDDLQQWRPLATFPHGSDGPDTLTDSAAFQTTRQRFYRLSVPDGESR
ncbi:MAG: fibronectin type III domain-containing protein [Verrucomicrobiota bacterium]